MRRPPKWLMKWEPVVLRLAVLVISVWMLLHTYSH